MQTPLPAFHIKHKPKVICPTPATNATKGRKLATNGYYINLK